MAKKFTLDLSQCVIDVRDRFFCLCDAILMLYARIDGCSVPLPKIPEVQTEILPGVMWPAKNGEGGCSRLRLVNIVDSRDSLLLEAAFGNRTFTPEQVVQSLRAIQRSITWATDARKAQEDEQQKGADALDEEDREYLQALTVGKTLGKSADEQRKLPMFPTGVEVPSLDHIPVGTPVFIRTVSYYYTGYVVTVTSDEVVLASASWIAETGTRFYNALCNGQFGEVEPYPRELTVPVKRDVITDWVVWCELLPLAQK